MKGLELQYNARCDVDGCESNYFEFVDSKTVGAEMFIAFKCELCGNEFWECWSTEIEDIPF